MSNKPKFAVGDIVHNKGSRKIGVVTDVEDFGDGAISYTVAWDDYEIVLEGEIEHAET